MVETLAEKGEAAPRVQQASYGNVTPMAQSRALRAGWLVIALVPLACAVAIEPELKDDGAAPRAGTSSAGTTSVGSTSAMGGTSVSAGTSSGGTSSSAGKPSTGGSSSAGSGAGGKGGTGGKGGAGGSGGTAGATTGGGSSTGCGGLKTWKGGDSTLQIAQGEVIQWMGKRYKATTTIAYPNMECAPDDPVDWCANWFESDGDC